MRFVVLLVLSALLPAAVRAQASPASPWRHAVDRTLWLALGPSDTTAPADVAAASCRQPVHAPDSLVVLPREIVSAWHPAKRRWWNVNLRGTDTAAVRVVQVACAPSYVILDRHGWLLRVAVETLGEVRGDENDAAAAHPLGDTRFLAQRLGDSLELVNAVVISGAPPAIAPPSVWRAASRRAQADAAARRRAAEAAAAAARRRERAAAAATRRSALRDRGWSPAVVEAIVEGRVTLGMTAAQVREAWGRPERINSEISESGTLEQWVYGSDYVYLLNGRVKTIRTSR